MFHKSEQELANFFSKNCFVALLQCDLVLMHDASTTVDSVTQMVLSWSKLAKSIDDKIDIG